MAKRSIQRKKRHRSKKRSWFEAVEKRLGCKRSLFSRKKSNRRRCKLWKAVSNYLTTKRYLVNNKKLGSQEGFSLLEILVVIVILGILVTIGLNSYRNSQIRSRDAKRKSETSQLVTALEMFYQDKRVYPASTEDGRIDLSELGGGVLGWGDPFVDPINTSTVYMSKLPEGSFYESVDTNRGFVVYTLLENQRDEDIVGYYARECAGASCNYAISSPNVPQPTPMPEPEPTSAPAPTATPAPTTAPTATPTPGLVCPADPSDLGCSSHEECIECYGAGYACFDRCDFVPSPTPTPTPACSWLPSLHACTTDSGCVGCYGVDYYCHTNNFCRSYDCPGNPEDYDCDNDQQCIECYGYTAKCVYDAFCGVPTGVGSMCWDDLDCFPGEMCVAGMCQ